MRKSTLEKYVAAFKAGDADAFDIIYEETRVDVYYVIKSILRDASLTEDLMQDAYMKMIEKLPDYTAKDEFKAWLTTLARNLALNAYNRRKREISVDYADNIYLFDAVYPDAEARYEIRELLESLEPIERDIVIRHVLLDEKHRTIAQTLNMPLGTVLWKYQQALRKLRKQGGGPFEK